jgi:hypothetical protein
VPLYARLLLLVLLLLVLLLELLLLLLVVYRAICKGRAPGGSRGSLQHRSLPGSVKHGAE